MMDDLGSSASNKENFLQLLIDMMLHGVAAWCCCMWCWLCPSIYIEKLSSRVAYTLKTVQNEVRNQICEDYRVINRVIEI